MGVVVFVRDDDKVWQQRNEGYSEDGEPEVGVGHQNVDYVVLVGLHTTKNRISITIQARFLKAPHPLIVFLF